MGRAVTTAAAAAMSITPARTTAVDGPRAGGRSGRARGGKTEKRFWVSRRGGGGVSSN